MTTGAGAALAAPRSTRPLSGTGCSQGVVVAVELVGQGVATIYGEAQSRPTADTAKIAPYARWHAARGNVVTNALHGLVQLTPEQAQAVKSGTPASAAQRAELMTLGLMV